MELRLIRYGMWAGFGFLMAVALLEWWASPQAGQGTVGGGGEGEITAQVWQVLAEARRIAEESAP